MALLEDLIIIDIVIANVIAFIIIIIIIIIIITIVIVIGIVTKCSIHLCKNVESEDRDTQKTIKMY